MKQLSLVIPLVWGLVLYQGCSAQSSNDELDRKIQRFLTENARNWRDMNVPAEDGQLLYDLIVKNNYRRALEIGTSTGHSTIWIAWAMSKTGGKVITVEIDEQRYREARENFKKAGVEAYVDTRLADAHQLARELTGPFDFVFSDADKGWYKQYFLDIDPKLTPGGCFTAHNVARAWGPIKDFLDYVRGLANYQTTIQGSSFSGVSVSYKK